MRKGKGEPPKYTARLVETPKTVRTAATRIGHLIGKETYEEPFEVASILRVYGVRVLSSLGEYASEALERLARHDDARVRAAVAEELSRHEAVSALETLVSLAEEDRVPEVQEAARKAVEALQRVAERLSSEGQAEEERPEPRVEQMIDIPYMPAGEDVPHYSGPVSGGAPDAEEEVEGAESAPESS